MSKPQKKALVPALRFPEFREAGEWEEKKLSQVCEINPTVNTLPEKFIYIDLESVESGHLLQKKIISREGAPSRAQRLLKIGDVLFQTVRPYQKNNYFFMPDNDINYVASTGYAQLRAHESNKYLFQYLHNDKFVSKVLEKCTGSNYPAINSSDLSTILVEIPEEKEQQKIADCLSSLDDLITAQTQKLAALKEHKKGLMQQLFPAEGETVPKLRFPEFRDEKPWQLKSIGKVLTEQARPINMQDEYNYSLVTVKRRYGGLVSRGVFKGKTIKVKSQFLLKENDFLISKRQIVHCACGVVPKLLDGSIVSNEYSILVPRKDNDVYFFNYFAQQPIVSESFLQCSIGIVIEKMLFKLNDWLKQEFLFPNYDEQKKIAQFLGNLDELITAQGEKVEALKSHKKGLMQQLFPSMDEVDG